MGDVDAAVVNKLEHTHFFEVLGVKVNLIRTKIYGS
jgi:hypothetical protein